jgi:hypothetical protein
MLGYLHAILQGKPKRKYASARTEKGLDIEDGSA